MYGTEMEMGHVSWWPIWPIWPIDPLTHFHICVGQCERADSGQPVSAVELRPGVQRRNVHVVAAVWAVCVALFHRCHVVSVRQPALRPQLRVVEVQRSRTEYQRLAARRRAVLSLQRKRGMESPRLLSILLLLFFWPGKTPGGSKITKENYEICLVVHPTLVINKNRRAAKPN